MSFKDRLKYTFSKAKKKPVNPLELADVFL